MFRFVAYHLPSSNLVYIIIIIPSGSIYVWVSDLNINVPEMVMFSDEGARCNMHNEEFLFCNI